MSTPLTNRCCPTPAVISTTVSALLRNKGYTALSSRKGFGTCLYPSRHARTSACRTQQPVVPTNPRQSHDRILPGESADVFDFRVSVPNRLAPPIKTRYVPNNWSSAQISRYSAVSNELAGTSQSRQATNVGQPHRNQRRKNNTTKKRRCLQVFQNERW